VTATATRARRRKGLVPDETPLSRAAVAANGDDLRAAGKAMEVCWIPAPQERVELPPPPGKREDGRLWFE
jgi:hypothetical protein